MYTHMYIYIYVRSIHPPIYLMISIDLSICLSIYISAYLFIHSSTCLLHNQTCSDRKGERPRKRDRERERELEIERERRREDYSETCTTLMTWVLSLDQAPTGHHSSHAHEENKEYEGIHRNLHHPSRMSGVPKQYVVALFLYWLCWERQGVVFVVQHRLDTRA